MFARGLTKGTGMAETLPPIAWTGSQRSIESFENRALRNVLAVRGSNTSHQDPSFVRPERFPLALATQRKSRASSAAKAN